MFINIVRHLTDTKVKVKVNFTNYNVCIYKSTYLNFHIPIHYYKDNYTLII